MRRMPVLMPLVAVIFVLATKTSHAQQPAAPGILAPPSLVDGVLTVAGTVLQPDEASTQEELPGLGHKFELFGAMVKDTDPENANGHSGNAGGGAGGNEVISADTAGGALAFAYRTLGGITIKALTNQINLKYFFVGPLRSCAAGSPRVVLLIDTDGDGDTDFAGNGHVNPLGNYGACAPNRWTIEDLTDELNRWEVTPGGFVPGLPTYPYAPWDTFAAAITAAFPSHQVRAGFLLDGESCSFSPAGCGKAYYDLFTLENRTLEIWQDAVKK